MDLNDILRAFFGFRGPSSGDNHEGLPEDGGRFGFFGPNFNQPGKITLDGEDDDDDDMLGSRGGFGNLPNDEFFNNFEKESQEMFRHFEEMFRNFGLSDFHSNLHVPNIETTPNTRSISPRDEMLKQPDELEEKVKGHTEESATTIDHQSGSNDKPVRFGDMFRSPSASWHWNIPDLPSGTEREDKDLDEQVKDGRLDEILKPKQQQPYCKSFSKSVSIQTIRKPDGTIEQRRTERDSEGNVTTTVTTSEDDQTPALIKPFKWPSISKWQNQQSPDTENTQKQDLFEKLFGSWNK